MKQRILELAFKVFDEFDPGAPGNYIQLDVDKFAKLIVIECADYLDAFNKEHMVEEGMGGAELKQHFGVE